MWHYKIHKANGLVIYDSQELSKISSFKGFSKKSKALLSARNAIAKNFKTIYPGCYYTIYEWN